MTRRSGLGRGLSALIPGSEQPVGSSIAELPVDRIFPNPRQPRSHFDEQELFELSASILEHGMIQPLIVTRDMELDDRFILVAGQRRLMAARHAGLETVPAIIRETSDEQMLELALVENLQRSDLNPLEEAEAFRQLSEDFSLSHEQIAERVGKSRVSVTNTLRLLKLPLEVQQALVERKITEGHARALLTLSKAPTQIAALQTIIIHDLNVRQAEELVRRLSGERPPQKLPYQPPPEIRDLEERLRGKLGTMVRLRPRLNGGTIVIHYYSDEELNALVDLFLKDEPI